MKVKITGPGIASIVDKKAFVREALRKQMIKRPANLDFHEMGFTDWLKALPNDHKAKREVKDIMLSIEIARDYLVDTGWDCHMDGSPYCLLCNLDRILENYEESLRNTEIPKLT